MKPSTFLPIASKMATQTPTTTTDTKSFTIPPGTSAILVSSETNDARITFDGTTPTATVGHKVPKDQAAALYLVGAGANLQVVSTASGNSVVQVTFLQ